MSRDELRARFRVLQARMHRNAPGERRQGGYGRRASDNKLPRHLRDLWLVLITGLMVLSFYTQDGQNQKVSKQGAQLSSDQRSLEAAARQLQITRLFLLENCARLNIQRVEANANNLNQFRVDRVILEESRLAPVQGTVQQRAFQAAFLAPLAIAVNTTMWTPRTNCARAVNNQGVRFRPPAPIAFAKQLPPYDSLHTLPVDFQ